jgi:hypothetical protein
MNPATLGKGPSPNEQKLQQQLEQGQHLMKSLMDTIAEKQKQLDDKDEEIQVKVADASPSVTTPSPAASRKPGTLRPTSPMPGLSRISATSCRMRRRMR